MSKYTNLKSLNVLYVEDEKDVREEVQDMLLLKVGNLHVAKNGQEGLEFFQNNTFDIIITDIKMPIMDGLEMISHIRKKDQNIPIVVTTAFNETSFLKKAIDLHVDKYITKPIDILQLFSVLNRAAIVVVQKKEIEEKDILLKNKEKIMAMGELIENLGHQWRQPLSIISTLATGMKLEKKLDLLDDEKIIEYCDNIDNTSQKLSSTIDSFKEYFSSKDNATQLNIKDIVTECYDILNSSLQSENINFITNSDEIEIVAIKSNIIQIIMTLINNTKDIFDQKEQTSKYIYLNAYKNENNLILTIKDNAGGIQKEILPKIFEPYFTTKHQSQGTGLGLYMLHTIVTKSMSGKITVKNIKENFNNILYEGAEFTVTIPIGDLDRC